MGLGDHIRARMRNLFDNQTQKASDVNVYDRLRGFSPDCVQSYPLFQVKEVFQLVNHFNVEHWLVSFWGLLSRFVVYMLLLMSYF